MTITSDSIQSFKILKTFIQKGMNKTNNIIEPLAASKLAAGASFSKNVYVPKRKMKVSIVPPLKNLLLRLSVSKLFCCIKPAPFIQILTHSISQYGTGCGVSDLIYVITL